MSGAFQNPYFLGVALSVAMASLYVLRHNENIPAFIFLLISFIPWLYQLFNIESLPQLRGVLFIMFLLVLVVRKFSKNEGLSLFNNSLMLLYISAAMFSTAYNGGDVNQYRAYFGLLIIPAVMSLCPANEKTVRHLTIAMALFGAANLVSVLLEWASLGWSQAYSSGLSAASSYRLLGLGGQGTVQGIYLVISLNAVHVLFLQAKSQVHRSMLIALGIGLAVALFGTLSRGAIGGWLLSFMFIQIRLTGLRFGPFVLAGVLFLLIVGLADILGVADLVAERFVTMSQESSALNRLTLVDRGLRLFSTSPFSGVGLGQGGGTRLEAHNTYLQILMETGIVGFTLFVLVLLRGVRGLMLRAETGADGFFRNPYYVGLLGTLLAILLDGTFHNFSYFAPMWLIIGIGFQVAPWRSPASVSLR